MRSSMPGSLQFSSHLYLLHVIEDPTTELYGMLGDYHACERSAYERTQEWLDALHRERLGCSLNCETVIERGELSSRVLKVVHAKDIDVIVFSAQTHQGFHLHLLANLPEKLVHKAPCHVFVVHSGSVEVESRTVDVQPERTQQVSGG